jgi:ABC-2 type transport system permease protein
MRIINRRNYNLLSEMVRTDFKLRYQGSALGYLWSLLKPLFLFGVLYVVFTKALRFGADPINLLLGIVLWTFFVEATLQGLMSIVNRGDLIRKINIPKYIIVASSTVSALINLLINLIVVIVFAVINDSDLTVRALYFPFVIIELYVFAQALAFLFSAIYVKLRDISHIWEVGLQMLFYATPIIYPITLVLNQSEAIAKIMLLSPVAQIITDAQYYLVDSSVVRTYDLHSGPIQFFPHLLVVACLGLAVYVFKKQQPYFAENI